MILHKDPSRFWDNLYAHFRFWNDKEFALALKPDRFLRYASTPCPHLHGYNEKAGPRLPAIKKPPEKRLLL